MAKSVSQSVKKSLSDLKATHWLVTGFNDEISMLVDGPYPFWVDKVYGGPEICPTTGTRHFQGHISCHGTQRGTTIKRWLPTSHFEPARHFKASITYAMKAETSDPSGAKVVKHNDKEYKTTELALIDLATVCDSMCECRVDPTMLSGDFCWEHMKHDYWHRVRKILPERPYLAGLYAKPDLYRLWENTRSVWFRLARDGYSITPSSTQSVTEGVRQDSANNEIIFPSISTPNASQKQQDDTIEQSEESCSEGEEGLSDS